MMILGVGWTPRGRFRPLTKRCVGRHLESATVGWAGVPPLQALG